MSMSMFMSIPGVFSQRAAARLAIYWVNWNGWLTFWENLNEATLKVWHYPTEGRVGVNCKTYTKLTEDKQRKSIYGHLQAAVQLDQVNSSPHPKMFELI